MDNTTNGTQNNTIKTDSPENTSKTKIPYVLDNLIKETLNILQTKGDEEAVRQMCFASAAG